MQHSAASRTVLTAAGAALGALALAGAAWGDDRDGAGIELPSGAVVQWQETLHDRPGTQGLTYRYRFVMPDLASRVPSTSGPASDFEDARGPINIDTETGEIEGAEVEEAEVEGAEVAFSALPGDDAAGADQASIADEEAADALLEAPALPAAPDIMAQDPVHQDVVWLCENWVLPRLASPAPRPAQIVISLSDRPVPFGAFDPDAVQLFEAFRLPPDRDICEWEPW